MKKILYAFLTILLSGLVGAAEVKVVPLPDLIAPDGIQADNHQLYITEKQSIYIYSLKDFRLVKKFGKAGEGPQEFRFSSGGPKSICADI